MWISLVVNSGTLATSSAQARAKTSRSASRQWVSGIAASGMVGRSIGRISRTRRSTSPSSSMRLGAGTCTAARPDWLLTSATARAVREASERLGERDRLVAFTPGDGQKARFGARARMGVNRAAIGDGEGIRRQRLKADIVSARRDRALDARREQLLEGGEQDVLHLDRQRQKPVEEGGDRRQLVAQTTFVRQPEAGRIFERAQRASLNLALEQQEIELAQRIARVACFPDCPRGGRSPGLRSGAGRA